MAALLTFFRLIIVAAAYANFAERTILQYPSAESTILRYPFFQGIQAPQNSTSGFSISTGVYDANSTFLYTKPSQQSIQTIKTLISSTSKPLKQADKEQEFGKMLLWRTESLRSDIESDRCPDTCYIDLSKDCEAKHCPEKVVITQSDINIATSHNIEIIASEIRVETAISISATGTLSLNAKTINIPKNIVISAGAIQLKSSHDIVEIKAASNSTEGVKASGIYIEDKLVIDGKISSIGGSIVIDGPVIELMSSSVLDVSGTYAGTILVGTSNRKRSKRKAETTLIYEGANLRADSTIGDGGEIIILAFRTTRYLGNISARSPIHGGFAEVSAEYRLEFDGYVDLKGGLNDGNLLIDPKAIDICAETTSAECPMNFAPFDFMLPRSDVSFTISNAMTLLWSSPTDHNYDLGWTGTPITTLPKLTKNFMIQFEFFPTEAVTVYVIHNQIMKSILHLTSNTEHNWKGDGGRIPAFHMTEGRMLQVMNDWGGGDIIYEIRETSNNVNLNAWNTIKLLSNFDASTIVLKVNDVITTLNTGNHPIRGKTLVKEYTNVGIYPGSNPEDPWGFDHVPGMIRNIKIYEDNKAEFRTVKYGADYNIIMPTSSLKRGFAFTETLSKGEGFTLEWTQSYSSSITNAPAGVIGMQIEDGYSKTYLNETFDSFGASSDLDNIADMIEESIECGISVGREGIQLFYDTDWEAYKESAYTYTGNEQSSGNGNSVHTMKTHDRNFVIEFMWKPVVTESTTGEAYSILHFTADPDHDASQYAAAEGEADVPTFWHDGLNGKIKVKNDWGTTDEDFELESAYDSVKNDAWNTIKFESDFVGNTMKLTMNGATTTLSAGDMTASTLAKKLDNVVAFVGSKWHTPTAGQFKNLKVTYTTNCPIGFTQRYGQIQGNPSEVSNFSTESSLTQEQCSKKCFGQLIDGVKCTSFQHWFGTTNPCAGSTGNCCAVSNANVSATAGDDGSIWCERDLATNAPDLSSPTNFDLIYRMKQTDVGDTDFYFYDGTTETKLLFTYGGEQGTTSYSCTVDSAKQIAVWMNKNAPTIQGFKISTGTGSSTPTGSIVTSESIASNLASGALTIEAKHLLTVNGAISETVTANKLTLKAGGRMEINAAITRRASITLQSILNTENQWENLPGESSWKIHGTEFVINALITMQRQALGGGANTLEIISDRSLRCDPLAGIIVTEESSVESGNRVIISSKTIEITDEDENENKFYIDMGTSITDDVLQFKPYSAISMRLYGAFAHDIAQTIHFKETCSELAVEETCLNTIGRTAGSTGYFGCQWTGTACVEIDFELSGKALSHLTTASMIFFGDYTGEQQMGEIHLDGFDLSETDYGSKQNAKVYIRAMRSPTARIALVGDNKFPQLVDIKTSTSITILNGAIRASQNNAGTLTMNWGSCNDIITICPCSNERLYIKSSSDSNIVADGDITITGPTITLDGEPGSITGGALNDITLTSSCNTLSSVDEAKAIYIGRADDQECAHRVPSNDWSAVQPEPYWKDPRHTTTTWTLAAGVGIGHIERLAKNFVIEFSFYPTADAGSNVQAGILHLSTNVQEETGDGNAIPAFWLLNGRYIKVMNDWGGSSHVYTITSTDQVTLNQENSIKFISDFDNSQMKLVINNGEAKSIDTNTHPFAGEEFAASYENIEVLIPPGDWETSNGITASGTVKDIQVYVADPTCAFETIYGVSAYRMKRTKYPHSYISKFTAAKLKIENTWDDIDLEKLDHESIPSIDYIHLKSTYANKRIKIHNNVRAKGFIFETNKQIEVTSSGKTIEATAGDITFILASEVSSTMDLNAGTTIKAAGKANGLTFPSFGTMTATLPLTLIATDSIINDNANGNIIMPIALNIQRVTSGVEKFSITSDDAAMIDGDITVLHSGESVGGLDREVIMEIKSRDIFLSGAITPSWSDHDGTPDISCSANKACRGLLKFDDKDWEPYLLCSGDGSCEFEGTTVINPIRISRILCTGADSCHFNRDIEISRYIITTITGVHIDNVTCKSSYDKFIMTCSETENSENFCYNLSDPTNVANDIIMCLPSGSSSTTYCPFESMGYCSTKCDTCLSNFKKVFVTISGTKCYKCQDATSSSDVLHVQKSCEVNDNCKMAWGDLPPDLTKWNDNSEGAINVDDPAVLEISTFGKNFEIGHRCSYVDTLLLSSKQLSKEFELYMDTGVDAVKSILQFTSDPSDSDGVGNGVPIPAFSVQGDETIKVCNDWGGDEDYCFSSDNSISADMWTSIKFISDFLNEKFTLNVNGVKTEYSFQTEGLTFATTYSDVKVFATKWGSAMIGGKLRNLRIFTTYAEAFHLDDYETGLIKWDGALNIGDACHSMLTATTVVDELSISHVNYPPPDYRDYLQGISLTIGQNTLITTLDSLSNTYELELEFYLNANAVTGSDKNIIHLTSDSGDLDGFGDGIAIPAIWIDSNKKIKVCNDWGVTTQGYCFSSSNAVISHKWTNIRLISDFVNQKFSLIVDGTQTDYYENIDGETTFTPFYANIKVYAASPWSGSDIAEGKIRNIKIFSNKWGEDNLTTFVCAAGDANNNEGTLQFWKERNHIGTDLTAKAISSIEVDSELVVEKALSMTANSGCTKAGRINISKDIRVSYRDLGSTTMLLKEFGTKTTGTIQLQPNFERFISTEHTLVANRLLHTFKSLPKQLLIEFEFFLTATTTSAKSILHLTIEDGDEEQRIAAFYLTSEAQIQVCNDWNSGVCLTSTTVLPTSTWIAVSFGTDFSNNQFKLTVDGAVTLNSIATPTSIAASYSNVIIYSSGPNPASGKIKKLKIIETGDTLEFQGCTGRSFGLGSSSTSENIVINDAFTNDMLLNYMKINADALIMIHSLTNANAIEVELLTTGAVTRGPTDTASAKEWTISCTNLAINGHLAAVDGTLKVTQSQSNQMTLAANKNLNVIGSPVFPTQGIDLKPGATLQCEEDLFVNVPVTISRLAGSLTISYIRSLATLTVSSAIEYGGSYGADDGTTSSLEGNNIVLTASITGDNVKDTIWIHPICTTCTEISTETTCGKVDACTWAENECGASASTTDCVLNVGGSVTGFHLEQAEIAKITTAGKFVLGDSSSSTGMYKVTIESDVPAVTENLILRANQQSNGQISFPSGARTFHQPTTIEGYYVDAYSVTCLDTLDIALNCAGTGMLIESGHTVRAYGAVTFTGKNINIDGVFMAADGSNDKKAMALNTCDAYREVGGSGNFIDATSLSNIHSSHLTITSTSSGIKILAVATAPANIVQATLVTAGAVTIQDTALFNVLTCNAGGAIILEQNADLSTTIGALTLSFGASAMILNDGVDLFSKTNIAISGTGIMAKVPGSISSDAIVDIGLTSINIERSTTDNDIFMIRGSSVLVKGTIELSGESNSLQTLKLEATNAINLLDENAGMTANKSTDTIWLTSVSSRDIITVADTVGASEHLYIIGLDSHVSNNGKLILGDSDSTNMVKTININGLNHVSSSAGVIIRAMKEMDDTAIYFITADSTIAAPTVIASYGAIQVDRATAVTGALDISWDKSCTTNIFSDNSERTLVGGTKIGVISILPNNFGIEFDYWATTTSGDEDIIRLLENGVAPTDIGSKIPQFKRIGTTIEVCNEWNSTGNTNDYCFSSSSNLVSTSSWTRIKFSADFANNKFILTVGTSDSSFTTGLANSNFKSSFSTVDIYGVFGTISTSGDKIRNLKIYELVKTLGITKKLSSTGDMTLSGSKFILSSTGTLVAEATADAKDMDISITQRCLESRSTLTVGGSIADSPSGTQIDSNEIELIRGKDVIIATTNGHFKTEAFSYTILTGALTITSWSIATHTISAPIIARDLTLDASNGKLDIQNAITTTVGDLQLIYGLASEVAAFKLEAASELKMTPISSVTKLSAKGTTFKAAMMVLDGDLQMLRDSSDSTVLLNIGNISITSAITFAGVTGQKSTFKFEVATLTDFSGTITTSEVNDVVHFIPRCEATTQDNCLMQLGGAENLDVLHLTDTMIGQIDGSGTAIFGDDNLTDTWQTQKVSLLSIKGTTASNWNIALSRLGAGFATGGTIIVTDTSTVEQDVKLHAQTVHAQAGFTTGDTLEIWASDCTTGYIKTTSAGYFSATNDVQTHGALNLMGTATNYIVSTNGNLKVYGYCSGANIGIGGDSSANDYIEISQAQLAKLSIGLKLQFYALTNDADINIYTITTTDIPSNDITVEAIAANCDITIKADADFAHKVTFKVGNAGSITLEGDLENQSGNIELTFNLLSMGTKKITSAGTVIFESEGSSPGITAIVEGGGESGIYTTTDLTILDPVTITRSASGGTFTLKSDNTLWIKKQIAFDTTAGSNANILKLYSEYINLEEASSAGKLTVTSQYDELWLACITSEEGNPTNSQKEIKVVEMNIF